MRIDTPGQAASNFIWRMPPISYEFLFMTMAAGSTRNFCIQAERDIGDFQECASVPKRVAQK